MKNEELKMKREIKLFESGKLKMESWASPLSPALSRREREQVVGEFMSRTTAGEGAIDCAKHCKNFSTFNLHKRVAFTLAEVLITLGVIGVVAAITMPILITNMTERKNSERHANIAYKVTQAMEHMRATGKLVQYDSTEAFVNELKKHLKIAKICDKDHIADCWPTETVTDKAGNEFEVSKAKKGKNLSLESETNNVGIVLADGAALILNYNPALTKGMDVGDEVRASNKDLPVGNGKMKNFAYTSTVTGPIDFITDVNGKGKPNRESESASKQYDIRSLKAASFSEGLVCDFEIGNLCGRDLLDTYSCINTCDTGEGGADCANNCQAGAKKACNDIEMKLANLEELTIIFNAKGTVEGVPNSYSEYWAFESPYHKNFSSGTVNSYSFNGLGSHWRALCVSK